MNDVGHHSLPRDVWIVCESRDGRVLEACYGLVAKAAALATAVGGTVGAILDRDSAPDTANLVAAGADTIFLISGCKDDSGLARFVAAMARHHQPEILLLLATVRGRAVAPQIAALLRTGLTADCVALEIDDDGLLVQTHPILGNTLIARALCPLARPQMATVRPCASPAVRFDSTRSGRIVEVPSAASDAAGVELLGSEPIRAATDIVLSGGAGVGSKAGFKRLARLAATLGVSLGASRAAVHAGYAPYACQVGQTGMVVRPRLYVAFGISGSIQHLAGMGEADFIIAINSDPRAPIFEVAHVGIVADLHAVLDRLERQFCIAPPVDR